jgi:hypothetical protein
MWEIRRLFEAALLECREDGIANHDNEEQRLLIKLYLFFLINGMTTLCQFY